MIVKTQPNLTPIEQEQINRVVDSLLGTTGSTRPDETTTSEKKPLTDEEQKIQNVLKKLSI